VVNSPAFTFPCLRIAWPNQALGGLSNVEIQAQTDRSPKSGRLGAEKAGQRSLPGGSG
jgi:hypothetical protein